MKTFFVSFALTITTLSVNAQSGAQEAKAAYLLAEEAFASNDYKKTISYLEECKASLGKANSKILYLQIMAELELSKTNPAYFQILEKSIAAFNKAPDIDSFNEEKVLEVMKIKLKLKEDKALYLEQEKERQAASQKFESVYNKLKNQYFGDLPTHVSYTTLKETRKDHPFFDKKHETAKEFHWIFLESFSKNMPGVLFIYHKDFRFKNGTLGTYVKEDEVVGYNLLVKSVVFKGKVDDLQDELKQLIHQFTREFGYAPEKEEVKGVSNMFNAAITKYKWIAANQRISILHSVQNNQWGKWQSEDLQISIIERSVPGSIAKTHPVASPMPNTTNLGASDTKVKTTTTNTKKNGAFANHFTESWELGKNVDELKAMHPAFFKNPVKTRDGVGEIYVPTQPVTSGVQQLYVKNDILYGTMAQLFNHKDDHSFSQGSGEIHALVQSFIEKFGFEAKEMAMDMEGTSIKTYNWTQGGKSVIVTFTMMKKTKMSSGNVMIRDLDLLEN